MTTEVRTFIRADVLVIGGGGAGLRAAIEAREHGADVLIVSASRVGYGSNTTISGGAFAAVTHQVRERGDSPEQHLEDTLRGGCFINDQDLVATMTESAEQQADDLRRFGVGYATAETSPWIPLSVDPGHSQPRLVYGGSAFGTDFTLPLRAHAEAQGVGFLEGMLITRLLKHGDRVVGAMGVDGQGETAALFAPCTILTAGGLGQAYARTDTAAGTTGDGYALAYDAGAVLQDMEFVQFYPLSLGSGTPAVYYECLFFGTGGRLLNRLGEDVISKHGLDDPMLLTRDRLSLAVAREMADGLGFDDGLALDLTKANADTMRTLLPILPKSVRRGERLLFVAPTAHFQMGGVSINEKAETSVSGLHAAGEVCAGVHGANRLSGNALTELWVFGTIAGREAALRAKEMDKAPVPEDDIALEAARLSSFGPDAEPVQALTSTLKETMWAKAGVIRDGQGLEQALDELAALRERAHGVGVAGVQDMKRALRLDSMVTASEMVCRSALHREESRGAHFRQDCPERDDANWLANVRISKDGDRMSLSTEPVKLKRLSP